MILLCSDFLPGELVRPHLSIGTEQMATLLIRKTYINEIHLLRTNIMSLTFAGPSGATRRTQRIGSHNYHLVFPRKHFRLEARGVIRHQLDIGDEIRISLVSIGRLKTRWRSNWSSSLRSSSPRSWRQSRPTLGISAFPSPMTRMMTSTAETIQRTGLTSVAQLLTNGTVNNINVCDRVH